MQAGSRSWRHDLILTRGCDTPPGGLSLSARGRSDCWPCSHHLVLPRRGELRKHLAEARDLTPCGPCVVGNARRRRCCRPWARRPQRSNPYPMVVAMRVGVIERPLRRIPSVIGWEAVSICCVSRSRVCSGTARMRSQTLGHGSTSLWWRATFGAFDIDERFVTDESRQPIDPANALSLEDVELLLQMNGVVVASGNVDR